MTVDEAREILGVKARATFDEIRAAYFIRARDLLCDDMGPAEVELSKKINEARELLLRA